MIAATHLEIEDLVQRALERGTTPVNSPTGRLYVPEGVQPRVLAWAHSSELACHPGARRTLALLSRRFWWPSVHQDTTEFVSACPVCAQAKGGSLCPQGLLQPLSVPHRPWSHVDLDFVTGLPESPGNTVILTVVDRFSKYGHFIPLPKLPLAKETVQLLLQHVFLIHGFLQAGRGKTPIIIGLPPSD